MANRFATPSFRQMGAAGGGGGDWWQVNSPTPGNPGAEQGGITGNLTLGIQPAPAAGMPPGQPLPPGVTPKADAIQGPEAFGNNYEAWFNSLLQGRPFNQQTLLELEPILNQYGVNLTPPNAAQDRTKIQLPDGTWVRVGFGEGKPVWVPQPGTGPGAGGLQDRAGAVGGGQPTNPWQTGWGRGGQPGGNVWSENAGELGGPPPFEMPTLADLQASPGYQGRLATGQQALERGAAAKGSVLSGGFQQALNRYAQNFATNEYGNLFGQMLNRYNTNVGTQSELPWRRYQDVLQGGQGAATNLGNIGRVPLG